MPEPHVTLAAEGDLDGVVSTLVLAFSADPVMRWIFREADDYLRWFPAMMRPQAEAMVSKGTVYRSGAAGASIWVPPGSKLEGDAVVEAILSGVPEADQDARFRFFGEMDTHHPDEEHWYLPIIGVDPACQGQGHGSAILARALQPCDEAGLPAYLESSNPANIPLYERFGFEVRGEIQVDDSPPMWPMYREARR